MKFEQVIAARATKTVYRDGDRCVKVFDDSYSKANVLNEALNQAHVEETGLHVPAVLEVGPVDGHWAIVSQYISGKTLARLMEEQPEKKAEYLELLVDLQLTVHSKSSRRLHTMRNAMERKIMTSELDAVTRYDLHAQLEDIPKHRKLCHGDFQPANIIISDDGVPYILDWSHATQGNGSADAAQTWLLMRLGGDEEGARAYLDLFSQKSGTEKKYIQLWMPVVAAARLNTAGEGEREFLLRVIEAEIRE